MSIFHPTLLKASPDLECPLCHSKLSIKNVNDCKYEDFVCLKGEKSGEHMFLIYESTADFHYTHYVFTFSFGGLGTVLFDCRKKSLKIYLEAGCIEIIADFEFSSFEDLMERVETYRLFS